MRCDYHMHSFHSMDGKQSICPQICEAALRAGIGEVCVTEHYEPAHPAPGADIPPLMPNVLDELRQARELYPALSIKLGIEIGDNPPVHPMIKTWLDEWPLDYRLLSLHLVDGHDPYEGEGFFGRYESRQKAYRAYAQAVLASIQSWDASEYDALAHFGYVGRYAPYAIENKAFQYQDAPDIIDQILGILALNGKALEINTSTYRRFGQPMAHESIVRRFKESGGEFLMFGSDAHGPEWIGCEFDRAYAMAHAAGFKYTYRFTQRKSEIISIP